MTRNENAKCGLEVIRVEFYVALLQLNDCYFYFRSVCFSPYVSVSHTAGALNIWQPELITICRIYLPKIMLN